MKTPRRKLYNINKDTSDVYIRELGPLEIGELETPNDRRSAPVAAVRYLAGSKCHSNSADESEYTENSDYTDARSVDSGYDVSGSYTLSRSYELPQKSTRRHPEVKSGSHDYEHLKPHPAVASSFAKEFKLRYASNITSHLQYQHTSKPSQDTFYHNMDYIHSQFTNFNPNFINFNYGHFSYPNYPPRSRSSDFYNSSYPVTHTANHYRMVPEFGYPPKDNYMPRNYDYYSRLDPLYNRTPHNYDAVSQNYMRVSDNYYRPPQNVVSSSYNRYPEYLPPLYQNQRHSDHREPPYDLRDRPYHPNIARREQDYGHIYSADHHETSKPNETDYSNFGTKGEEAIQLAIEKAVKNVLDTYVSTNKPNKGDETCITEPAYDFKSDKNDTTLTHQHQEQLYPDGYPKTFKEFLANNDNFGSHEYKAHGHNPKEDQNTEYTGRNSEYKEQYEPSGAQKSSEFDLVEPASFNFKKLGSEIQKVIDDLDLLTNYEPNKSDDKTVVTYSDHNNDNGYSDSKKSQLFQPQYTDNKLFDSKRYGDQDLFSNKFSGGFELANKDMRESQSAEAAKQFTIGESYLKNEALNQQESNRHLSKNRFTHTDLFNSEQAYDEHLMEERLTNPEDDDQTAMLAGSNYEMAASVDYSNYNNKGSKEYQDTNYYSSSSFNLNTFNSFNSLKNGAKTDLKPNEGDGENQNGTTLSTSDLIESRNQAQNDDDYTIYDYHANYGSEDDYNNRNRKDRGSYSISPVLKSLAASSPDDNPFIKKHDLNKLSSKLKEAVSDSGPFNSEKSSFKFHRSGIADDKMSHSYTHSQVSSGQKVDLRAGKSSLFYQNQSQNGSLNPQNYKFDKTKDRSDCGTSSKSDPHDMDAVLHMCARMEKLEESFKRIESRLNDKSEPKYELQKDFEFKFDNSHNKPNSVSPKDNHLSNFELMEGYKAASVIKKLLHVKSMESLIPAFTAFVQNRMN